MNFTPQQKAWILLLALIVGSSATVIVTSYMGGAKIWVSVLLGLGTAGTNVYHALNKAPADASESKSNPPTNP